MKKLVLDVEALQVESFQIVGSRRLTETGADSGGHYCCGMMGSNEYRGYAGTVEAFQGSGARDNSNCACWNHSNWKDGCDLAALVLEGSHDEGCMP